MTEPGWVPVPLTVVTDPNLGGRWTSLRGGDREWLWTNPDPAVQAARPLVQPGDEFVDAGGLEECFPTVRGVPDHGDIWSRPWHSVVDGWRVETAEGLSLTRRVEQVEGAVVAHHHIEGPVGTPFLHASHALLALSEEARLEVADQTPIWVLDVPEAPTSWPAGLDRLGPDDGTATCVIIDTQQARVIDDEDLLELTWSSPHPVPLAMTLWRNLCGWPDADPYRSIGIEPMVGRAGGLDDAPADRVAVIGAQGFVDWMLRITAARRG